MTDPLSHNLEVFVEQQIASGNFADRNAVIECALRFLQRDREEAILGIHAGLEDVSAGRTQALEDAFDDLRSEFKVSKDA